ncbi:alpha/beta hydrolase fold domain-containing protein, partial [Salmonella enterica subsp. enterica serovar Virginia]|nr:alpha/beta hydrolase fold domain-containing protein [Salmonella enterica subsp. enterica serovar Virginia]
PLRDEGEALYQRFQEQGVECTCQRYLGVIHGFFQLGGVSQAAHVISPPNSAQPITGIALWLMIQTINASSFERTFLYS